MIYIVFAAPRQGKTYFCTKIALEELKKAYKTKRKVYSNYPIYHKKYGSTYKWEPGMEMDNITDATIIIDEAYQVYNSRNFKGFSKDEHLFFATNGHNGNDIWLIAQSPARVDVVIREITDMFYFVKKYAIPFTQRPVFFVIEGYQDETCLAKRFSADKPMYSREFHRFSKSVATAYDTHQFRVSEEPKIHDKWFSSKLPQPTEIEETKNSVAVNIAVEDVPRKNEKLPSNFFGKILKKWVRLWMQLPAMR